MKKQRLDQLVCELGLTESRERAKTTIMSGLVFVNGQRADKPGMSVSPDAKVLILNTWSPSESENENGEQERIEKSKQYEEGAIFAAKAMGLDENCIVPAGRVVESLMQKGVPDIYRDKVHLTLSLGRYAAAQTLYSFITRKSAVGNSFRTFRGPRTEEDFLFMELGTAFPEPKEEDILTVQQTVDEVLGI